MLRWSGALADRSERRRGLALPVVGSEHTVAGAAIVLAEVGPRQHCGERSAPHGALANRPAQGRCRARRFVDSDDDVLHDCSVGCDAACSQGTSSRWRGTFGPDRPPPPSRTAVDDEAPFRGSLDIAAGTGSNVSLVPTPGSPEPPTLDDVDDAYRTARTLDRRESLRLLGGANLGRVALSDRALPVVLPVLYRVVRDAIEFEATGRLLMTAGRDGHVVCFEADAIDHDHNQGWSVLVTGRLAIAAAQQTSARAAWTSGGRATTMSLPTTMVSGRVHDLAAVGLGAAIGAGAPPTGGTGSDATSAARSTGGRAGGR